MNEVNMLNIGGVDYNIDDQHVRDLIAHSENGLDSQSNLPVSSRHYDEGEYLIGQDRYYYEATTDIEIGDVLAEGINLRKTLISDELVNLKNQSSIAVIQCIAKRETGALASSSYPIVGSYLYWDYGLTAGLYETIAAITAGDALTEGVNLKSASKIADTMDGLQDAYNITGAKNLCPNLEADTVTTDITWDVLSDGSIQVTGTPAANRSVQLGSEQTLPAGTYLLSTGQTVEYDSQVCLYAFNSNTALASSNSRTGSNYFTLTQPTVITFKAYALEGTAVNVRIFPMCRVASITDDTYVPYAMTNKQLTDNVNNLNSNKQNNILIQIVGKTITGNGQRYRENEYTVAKSGYTFLGVGGWAVGNVEYYLNCIKKNGKLYAMAYNTKSTWTSSLSFTVELIYAKNS